MSVTSTILHQVDILYDDHGGENLSPVCAGTIISAYFILTVASCLAGRNESRFKIRANGMKSSGVDESGIGMIESIRIHTYAALDSDSSPFGFDVALIRLKSELKLEGVHTLRVPFYKSQSLLSSESSCEASVCQKVSKMSLLDSSECSARRENKNVVCTTPVGKVEELSKCETTLPGSSLLCGEDETPDTLYGVFAMTSSSENEGSGEKQMVFTNVGAYASWIRLALEQDEQENLADQEISPTPFASTVVNPATDPAPYQLSIKKDGKHICSGIILDKKTALSAAHCFKSRNYTVVAGEQNLNKKDSTEQIFPVDQIIPHPDFTNLLLGNDIAVIRIKGQFNFSERVSNAWISSRTTPDFEVLKGSVTGWAGTDNHGRPSTELQRIELGFLPQKNCRRKWTFLKESMFCGYDEESFSCKGNSDSGSPLVLRNYEQDKNRMKDLLIGITSFAPEKCDDKYQPTGFTNISHFYEWIEEQRNPLDSSCSPSQFQCFSGECINKELKCDKKYDCKDGSDERVCNSYSQVTRTCGGLIKLTYNHEIEWKAPTSHPHENSSCLWIIANPYVESPTTQIKILDSSSFKFDNAASQLYVVENLIGNKSSPSVLTKIDSAHNFNQPFLMVYFRSSSTSKNSGIHLKISDTTESSTYIVRNIKEREEISSESQMQRFFHAIPKSHCKRKENSPSIFQKFSSQNSIEGQNPPYVVSIKLDGEHLCTGVILDNKTVLSTASCFSWNEKDDIQLNAFRIVAGEQNLSRVEQSSTEQSLEIERLVKHEDWIYPLITEGNDIALIHVKDGFEFNDYVSNIWISTPEILNLKDTNEGSVSGWIATNGQDADFLPDLQTMNMDLLQESECQETYPFLKESMICGFKNATNVCGLSGAPFVLKNQSFGDEKNRRDVLLGISIFGPSECESIDRPIAFTRVDYFYDWIEKNRANSSCSSSEFQCYDGQCIPKKKKCDYTFDCTDGSDESVCSGESGTKSESSTKIIRQLDSCAPRLQGRKTALEPENLFVFLKPAGEGGRIQAQLNSLQMKTEQDSLKVISYRPNSEGSGSFEGLEFDGVGNWSSNKIFYGDENEPVVLYFRALPGNESQRVDFKYMEKPRITPSHTCGETLELEEEMEIVYQISSEDQNSLTSNALNCEWNIQNSGSGSNGSSDRSWIEVTLFHDPAADFDTVASTLSVLGNSALSTVKEMDKKYETYRVDASSMTLTFQTKHTDPNTGFHLYLKRMSSDKRGQENEVIKSVSRDAEDEVIIID